VSIAKRLAAVIAVRSNTGCATCEWLSTLPTEDRAAIEQWVTDGMSVAQLHEILSSEANNPLPVSDSAFRNHLKRHQKPVQ
jgi:hypothetical protein